MNTRKNITNSLFIICPFCQLENFLRTKFGDDILFMTATAGVLNFNDDEISAIKDFIKREQISTIYVVNDIGCNFIEEAINNKKEFGLPCESELRKQWQTIQSKVESQNSLREKNKIVAENNLQQQAKYLASTKILKHEIDALQISIHTLIIDKHESINHLLILN